LEPVDESREAYHPDAKSGLKQGRRCNAGRVGTPVLSAVLDGSSEEQPGLLAQDLWRNGGAPHLVALIRAGATFTNGRLAGHAGDAAALTWPA
jgi:hypothetical protein